MSLHCLNPSCFSGDFGNPPDYQSDNPFVCNGCGETCDFDEEFGGYDKDDNRLCTICYDNQEEEEER